MNLVDLQVYRVEKVGKYSLSPSKKSIFNFFNRHLKINNPTPVFGFFGQGITTYIFKNNIFRTNPT
jgi:hypothetical protein